MPIELPPGTASYSDRSSPPEKRQYLVLFGITVAIVIAAFWLFNALVNGLVWVIPPGIERQLGVLTVPTFERLAKPSPAQDTLNQLLDRLETHLPAEQRQDRDYQVLFVPDPTVNALAIPGDRIIIYKGLLDKMESENELMMVLGHELGHFSNRDHLRALGRGLVLQLALATFLGDIGSLQTIAVSGVTALSDARFSQNQEYRADSVGLDLLQATYGHVAGATDFFAELSQQLELNIEFLSTHPASQNRVKRLEEAIAQRGYRLGEKRPLPAALAGE
ncbi:MAG: M48 family metallopeptidase [Oculatellaceae cyanobacterium bins.114]|nr:M48 family metallopeptidase [Oculatellaceae cyanobacterium bins.114]